MPVDTVPSQVSQRPHDHGAIRTPELDWSVRGGEPQGCVADRSRDSRRRARCLPAPARPAYLHNARSFRARPVAAVAGALASRRPVLASSSVRPDEGNRSGRWTSDRLVRHAAGSATPIVDGEPFASAFAASGSDGWEGDGDTADSGLAAPRDAACLDGVTVRNGIVRPHDASFVNLPSVNRGLRLDRRLGRAALGVSRPWSRWIGRPRRAEAPPQWPWGPRREVQVLPGDRSMRESRGAGGHRPARGRPRWNLKVEKRDRLRGERLSDRGVCR